MTWDFPGGTVVKNLPDNAGDLSSIPGSGRSPGGGNGKPLQYACLEKSHGQRRPGGVAKSQTRPSDQAQAKIKEAESNGL